MSDENPFGDGFSDLSALLAAASMIASLNRTFYLAHIEQGFTSEEAMEFTKHSMDLMLRPFAEVIARNTKIQ